MSEKHFVRAIQWFGVFIAIMCMVYWVLTRFSLFLILALACAIVVLGLMAYRE